MRGWLNPLRGSGIRGWLTRHLAGVPWLDGQAVRHWLQRPPRLHRGCSPRDTPGGSDRELLPIGGRVVERELSRCGCGQCRALLQICCAEVNFFRLPRFTRLHRGCSPRATLGVTDRELLPIGIARASDFHESHDCIPVADREVLPRGAKFVIPHFVVRINRLPRIRKNCEAS